MLLDRGANINAENQYGFTPLHIAVVSKKMEIIELLFKKGAHVNCADRNSITPFHLAIEEGSEEIIKLLLQHGAYVNTACTSPYQEVYTPLCLAVQKGHQKVVKLLLECKANVDAQDKDGKTVLHFAVENGCSVIIEHVLKHCPDVNNRSNRSTLNVAVHGSGEEYGKIVKNLLQYGFTVSPEDVNNCKLLHAAVEKGYC
jgi:ankyrin repeat protein